MPSRRRNLLAAGGSAGVAAVIVTKTANLVDSASKTVYTFSAVDIGASTNPNKQVFVIAGANVVTDVSSITVGGNATSSVVSIPHGSNGRLVMFKLSTTDINEDIVVDWGTGRDLCGIGVFEVLNGSTTIHATASDVDHQLTANIDVLADGGLIGAAIAIVAGATPTWTWTNITERYDEAIETNSSHSGASDIFSTLQSGLTVTATPSDTAGSELMVLASIAPL